MLTAVLGMFHHCVLGAPADLGDTLQKENKESEVLPVVQFSVNKYVVVCLLAQRKLVISYNFCVHRNC